VTFVDPETTFKVVSVRARETSTAVGPILTIKLHGEGGLLDGVTLYANHPIGKPFVTDQSTSASAWAEECTRPE